MLAGYTRLNRAAAKMDKASQLPSLATPSDFTLRSHEYALTGKINTSGYLLGTNLGQAQSVVLDHESKLE